MVWVLFTIAGILIIIGIIKQFQSGTTSQSAHSNSIKTFGNVRGGNITEDDKRRIEKETTESIKRINKFGIEHELALAKAKNKAREHEFGILMELQSNGKTYEELSSPDEAIAEYEKSVDFGENSPYLHINNYLHSIDRLAILYRKKKLYEKEKAILDLALKHQMHQNQRIKLETRLNKVLEIIEKQNKIDGQKQSI